MRIQRLVIRFASLLILLYHCSLRSETADTNPVYPDETSISNGAQLYDVYCSECHGRDTTSAYSRMYAPDARAADEHSKAVDLAQRKEPIKESAEEPIPVVKEKAPWPKWADRPDPDAEAPPDPKQETIAELTAVIDEAHGISPTPEKDKEPGKASTASEAAPFEPTPGATNLADPTAYFYGTSEEEMFNNIANGTGTTMVGLRDELGTDNAIWDVINYLRSFWGEEWRN
jgi:mono/diheme cytochrome c family protein